MAININHKENIISVKDELLKISTTGAVKIGNGKYLNELDDISEIEPSDDYKGALRYNEDLGLMEYCDGKQWRTINGQYKQTSNIVYSLLF